MVLLLWKHREQLFSPHFSSSIAVKISAHLPNSFAYFGGHRSRMVANGIAGTPFGTAFLGRCSGRQWQSHYNSRDPKSLIITNCKI